MHRSARKRGKTPPITSLLLGLLVGALCGWAGMQVGRGLLKSAAPGQVPGWMALVFTMLCCFGGLLLHEIGHLLAGLRVGFTPYLFAVGPLRIERDERGKYRWKGNRDIALWGGAVASLPSNGEADPDLVLRKFAFIVLGGPLMSLTVAALCLSFCPLLPGSLSPPCLFLQILGGVSAVFFLITAVPMPNGDFLTDGARFLQLMRGGSAARRDAALLQLYALVNTGKPACEWPDHLVNDVLEPDDDSVFASSGRFFAYLRAVDRGEMASAAAYLQRAMETAGSIQRPAYATEAAYFAAWSERDVVAAESLLAEAGKNPFGISEADMLRTRAAIALRRGDLTEGKTLLDRAEIVLATAPAATWTRARLAELRAAFFSATCSQN